MRKNRLQKGFTLVELIVASSVLATLMLAAAGPFVSMVEFRRNTSNQADINDNLKLIVSIIDKEVRTANPDDDLFDICNDGFGLPTGVSFETQEDQQIRYQLVDERIVKTVMPVGTVVASPCTDLPTGSETFDVTTVDALYIQSLAFRLDGLDNDEPPIMTVWVEASSDDVGTNNVVTIQNTTLLRNRAP